MKIFKTLCLFNKLNLFFVITFTIGLLFLSGCEELYSPDHFSTLTDLELIPTLITPADNSIGISISPTFSWNASTNAISYTLQLSTSSSFNEYVFNQSGLVGTSQQIAGLNNNTKYYWRMNANDGSHISGYSSVFSFTTISTSISGIITNSSNQPISGAKVYTSPSTSTVYSDTYGNYSININSGQTFTLFVEKTGYLNYSISLTIVQGTANTQNITMTAYGAPCTGIPTVTYAGETYNTIQIGTQCWFKENLDIGTMIQTSANSSNNGTIEKYCYGNNSSNCTTYGGLYQWDEAMSYSTLEGSQGICPDGWHIPTEAEFQTLAAGVSNNSNSLKAIGQGSGSGAGNNTSGFSALLAGYRKYDGTSNIQGSGTYFWSSTEMINLGGVASNIYLSKSDSQVLFYGTSYDLGYSIRCMKN